MLIEEREGNVFGKDLEDFVTRGGAAYKGLVASNRLKEHIEYIVKAVRSVFVKFYLSNNEVVTYVVIGPVYREKDSAHKALERAVDVAKDRLVKDGYQLSSVKQYLTATTEFPKTAWLEEMPQLTLSDKTELVLSNIEDSFVVHASKLKYILPIGGSLGEIRAGQGYTMWSRSALDIIKETRMVSPENRVLDLSKEVDWAKLDAVGLPYLVRIDQCWECGRRHFKERERDKK